MREIHREFISRWGSKQLFEITRKDVVAVLDAAVDRGAPYQAHNLLGHIRALFNWAIGRGIYGIEHSPCDRLKPKAVIGKKLPRKRVLNDEEIRALWIAAGKLDFPFGQFYRLLLLTGQRKSEVAQASWPEFDLDKGIWTIPSARMKSDAPHIVPLAPKAIAILNELRKRHFPRGNYVFTTTYGEKPISGFSKGKRKLDTGMLAELRAAAAMRGTTDSIELAHFVVHDIRRSVRTHLSALPVADLVRELIIAHTKPGLHKTYDQYQYLSEKRRGLELWEERLSGILEPEPGNVVRSCNHKA